MNAPVRLIAGHDARRLLDNPAFRRDWDALADACPWATAFQRAAYASVWFAVYASDQTPVLILQYDDTGDLIGLLMLTHGQRGGNSRPDEVLAHVGRYQAEYQVWLVRPSHADTFPVAALLAVREAYPQLTRLRLAYLPAGVPLEWIPVLERAGIHVVRQTHRRGRMRTDTKGTIETSLRKSSNRSRLARLQRLGPIVLERLETRASLEPLMDEIIVYCDLRHGAEHDVLPFADDPRKREFHLSLLETPGVAHATVLRAGSTLVAAHLSVVDHRAVPLGLLAHAPAQAACSPGKLLLLLLGRQLGEQGYSWFDLTPGDDPYKERFASEFDEVGSVEIWFNTTAARTAARRQRRWRNLHSVVQHLRRRGGLRATRLETGLRRLMARYRAGRVTGGSISTLRSLVATSLHRMRRWLWDEQETRYYHRILPGDAPSPIDHGMRQNALDDLLRYRPLMTGDRLRREFLRDALARLEQGAIPITWVLDGVLHYCGWMKQDAVLWDDVVHPAARACGLEDAIRQFGFTYAGSRSISVRFGRRREWNSGDALP